VPNFFHMGLVLFLVCQHFFFRSAKPARGPTPTFGKHTGVFFTVRPRGSSLLPDLVNNLSTEFPRRFRNAFSPLPVPTLYIPLKIYFPQIPFFAGISYPSLFRFYPLHLLWYVAPTPRVVGGPICSVGALFSGFTQASPCFWWILLFGGYLT